LEGLGTSCSWDYSTPTLPNRLYYLFLLSFGFLLPVTVIGVSYGGILWVVCKHSAEMTGATSRTTGDVCKQSLNKTDLKTAKVRRKFLFTAWLWAQ
jgi:r-opsin